MSRKGIGVSRYVCPVCGCVDLRAGTFSEVPEERRVYRGQEERAPEVCGKVDHYAEVGLPKPSDHCQGIMVWTPESSATDLLREDFIVDLGDGPRRISSLTELRAIERDSEQRHKDGRGAIHIFRDLSQNSSNRHVNTLSGSSYEKNKSFRPPARVTSSGLPLSVRSFSPGEE